MRYLSMESMEKIASLLRLLRWLLYPALIAFFVVTFATYGFTWDSMLRSVMGVMAVCMVIGARVVDVRDGYSNTHIRWLVYPFPMGWTEESGIVDHFDVSDTIMTLREWDDWAWRQQRSEANMVCSHSDCVKRRAEM